MKYLGFVIFMATLQLCAQGPFSPAAGQAGTTAIHKDSSVFKGWATAGVLYRGLQNISNPSLGSVTHGIPENAEGPPDAAVVSLGDSGYITCTFPLPVYNGPGADFAVFENSFSDTYLELAFVEVSSDGSYFVRFPAVSLTAVNQQVASFGNIDPTEVHNFAGKYRGGFGVPFDLEDLKDSTNINLQAITHIRVVDVIGAVDSSFSSYDTQGNQVNDPYPTPFPSGGFDLDAIGIIHSGYTFLPEQVSRWKIYPNPASDLLRVESSSGISEISLFTINGIELYHASFKNRPLHAEVELSFFAEGIYLLKCDEEFSKVEIRRAW